jgi:hypothetical protein
MRHSGFPFIVVLMFLLVPNAPAQAKDHTLRIVIHVKNGGAVGAHVSHYDGQTKAGVDVDGHEIRVPTGGSRFHILMSRDDHQRGDKRRVTKDHPWDETVTNGEGGIYIMDLPDWNHNPDVEVEFYIDGVLRFKGHGSANNFDRWQMKEYGKATRKTDDREVAVDIAKE